MSRTIYLRALDALEVGNQRECAEILLSALEDVGAQPVLLCPRCGLDCVWPGRLEAHLGNVHWQEKAA